MTGENLELVAAQTRERLTAILGLGLLGDHQAVAELSDKLIEDLRRRSVDQLVHVIGELAHNDPHVLAQIVVYAAKHDALYDAEAMVLSTRGVDHA